MNTSLVQFGATAQAVESINARTGSVSVRLMTAKEFKDSKGLKGQEGKRQYNDYLRTQGKANTAGLAAAMTSGDLLVKSFQTTKNGMRVGFVFKDKLGGGAELSKEDQELMEIVKASGLTVEQILALVPKSDLPQ